MCVDDKTYEQITAISDKTSKSVADVTRELIKKGLASEWVNENDDLISRIVRQQLEAVLRPQVERICSLASKTGHMAATATFLNVQALMDIVPAERRKDVRPMYDSARKKAVEYMRTPTTEWNEKEDKK